MTNMRYIIAILIGYGLGCFCTAYYLVRWRTGQDVRELGSGNAGAKNAGRVLGTMGFVVAFLGDLGKGILAILFARLMGLDALGISLAFIAAVLGHLYPVQLGFRGGKGVSVAYGAVLVINFTLAMISFVIAAIVFALTREFTLSGLAAIVLAPIAAAVLLHMPVEYSVAIFIVAVLLVLAHKSNIRALIPRSSN